MTLLAVRVEQDYAEILTDTLAYTPVDFFTMSKVDVMPHIDAAVVGRGPTDLMHWWGNWRDLFMELYGDLDELEALTPTALQQGWEDGVREKDHVMGLRNSAHIVQVGWSPSRERFVAYDHRQEDDFAPVEIAQFLTGPALEPTSTDLPVSDEDWAGIGEAIYEQAGYTLGPHSYMGGDLLLTRVERGALSVRKIHTLPADDWRFRQMMIGTLHPEGQIGPCPCGKDQPFTLCHMAAMPRTWPCSCPDGQQGRAFFDCHRVDPDSPEAEAYLTEHAEEFRQIRDDLRRRWTEAGGD